MKLSLFNLLSILFVISILSSCARRGTPTGGPKDSIPPVLVKSIPINETVNFTEKKIKIYFDEYIKLKDVKTQLIISPPQKNEPEITPVGTASKFISIKILDTLDANTTYVYNFGNSIVDNNEENKLGNFKYIFSTGTYIDSLLVSGEVKDPSLKKSATNLDVMLYEYDSTFTDSIIFKQKPRYIANTLDSTLFEITNIRNGKYMLIALNDANKNKKYDPDVDKIGFVKDTITLPTNEKFNFSIFKEVPELLIIKPKEVNKGHLIFGYKGNANNLIINMLSEKPTDFKSEIVYEKGKDTINYWYTPFEADSLNFSVSKGDYFEELTTRIRSTKIDTLKLKSGNGSVLNLRDTLYIESNSPMIRIDTSLISIIDQDTLMVNFKSTLSKSKTKLYLNFEKKQASKYAVKLLPKAISDVYNMPNDTLSFAITTKKIEDYGILNINLTSTKKSSFIVELLNNKNEVIRVGKLSEPGIVRFESLDPGNYFLKVVVDENNNGIWDTGNFLEKRQPEIIKFFDKIIELRANWDQTEAFTID